MADKRRKFDAEFRERAVRIVAETGRSVRLVARDLGINEMTLASWVPRAKRAGGGGTLSAPEREELARLRRQDMETNKRIRELEMERGVLKHCTGAPRPVG